MQHPGTEAGRTGEQALVRETLAQVALADRVGFDQIWFVEHHFLDTFSLCPSTETMLAAASQITKRARLGFGVVILPYHHPVQVAERVAMIDHLSDGRVEFGTGRGSFYEQTGLGVDPRDTLAMWEESLRAVLAIWQSEKFAWDGRFWKVPERTVVPKQFQQPHPPVWNACLSPGSYVTSAELGLGVLAFAMTAPEKVRAQIAEYRERIQDARPIGAYVNNRWTNYVLGYCDEDNAAGRELGARAIKSFFGPGRPYTQGREDIYRQLLESWGYEVPEHLKAIFNITLGANPDDANRPADLAGGEGRDKARSYAIWNQLPPDELAERGVIVAGDPASCLAGLRLHAASGADMLLLGLQVDQIPHEKVMNSIRLLGERVLPAFRG
jgi:alkanesulfonate monooxygenase SsuD/methylene tetrahydromethanopterin reductase-like flavin-dependent oxidoreductase (luciferase family)